MGDSCSCSAVNIMLREALLFLCVLAGAHGFLGMGDRCVPVPSHLCAIAYDDDGCKGWRLDIPVGEKMFKWWDPVFYWYRNDIEQVSVRAGCSFTGFDEKIQSYSCVCRA